MLDASLHLYWACITSSFPLTTSLILSSVHIPVSLSPSIVNDLQWEALQAQLPTTPPYVVQCIRIVTVYLTLWIVAQVEQTSNVFPHSPGHPTHRVTGPHFLL